MNSPEPKRRFTAVVDDYERYRPSYPEAALAWIEERADLRPGSRVVDLGCGTGISSRAFATRGLDVTGVEPNDEMRARAVAAGGGPRYVHGEAAATGLPERCADLVAAAQAFHWFDLPATQREARRVLRPGGRCAALWNLRASTPFLDEYEALLRRRSEEYAALRRPRETIAALKALSGVSGVEERWFRHSQAAALEAVLGRARSSSYVAHGVSDPAAFEAELSALFAKHARDGRVDFAYDTVVLLFIP